MFELAVKIILFGSIAGMGFIILKKIPVLSALSKAEIKAPKKKENFFKKIKIPEPLSGQKIFSKLKNLKREKSQKEKKVNLSEDYWEKIKKG